MLVSDVVVRPTTEDNCFVLDPYGQCTHALTVTAFVHRIDNKNLAVAEMGDRLATIDMSRKVGVFLFLFP